MNHFLSQKIRNSRFVPFKGFLTSVFNMTTSTENSFISIDYDLVIEFIKIKAYIVDVREKQELLETGTLPNSVNIPVGEVETALQLSEDEFISLYGANKPKYDKEIIFSCRSGRRSEMAAQTAIKLGFEKVLNYRGGWLDWEKHQSQKH